MNGHSENSAPRLTPKQQRDLMTAYVCERANGPGLLKGDHMRALERKGLATSRCVRRRLYTLTLAGIQLAVRLRGDRAQP